MGLLLGTVTPKSCTVAVWEGRRAVAVAQVARQSGREQWEMMFVAVAGLWREAPAPTGAASAWLSPLLDEVCRVAGAQRITGIVARVPARGWLAASFQRAGFSVVTEERTFARPVPRAALAPDVPGLRLQEKRDAWPLHQLYLRATPQMVRLAEGRTARDWQLGRSSSRLSFQATRWVVEGENGLTGWLTESRSRNSELRAQIGVAPGQGDLARDLVATALSHAHDRGSAAVWSRVPVHAADVTQALIGCGFGETERGLVLKRALAVRVRGAFPAQARPGEARGGLPATQGRALAVRSNDAMPAGSAGAGPRSRAH